MRSDHATFWVFVVCGLGLAIFNLSTKFEVSVSTHYEDMKGNTKWKWGGLGQLGLLNVTVNSTVQ